MKCGYRLCPRSDAIPPTPLPARGWANQTPENRQEHTRLWAVREVPFKNDGNISKFEHYFKLITYISTRIFETICRRGWNNFLPQEVAI